MSGSLKHRAGLSLSRVLMESLPDLDYLDKAAQVSIFCVGDRTSRYYLNLQSLQAASRSELLKQLDASICTTKFTHYRNMSSLV